MIRWILSQFEGSALAARSWLAPTLLLFLAAMSASGMAQSADNAAAKNIESVYGSRLEGFEYPWPVATFGFHSQRQELEMAYMDVRPNQPNGRVVVLMHGKNFCAATWQETINALVSAGYRVIAPDQIGFCKSSKPGQYQFSFQQLAANTHALLESLGIHRVTLIGHSTGGMLGTRYALMYPSEVDQLVLVDPIGLEDWKARGVPWQSLDTWYEKERKTTAERIRAYERSTYYADTWKPAYERWVQMLAGMYRGPGRDAVAWDSALIYDMIYTQPVFYEFRDVHVPVLLMVGDKDNTAIGKDVAPPEARVLLGNYPMLAKAAISQFPNGKLIEFPELGHAPQIQAPERFHKALLHELQMLDTQHNAQPQR